MQAELVRIKTKDNLELHGLLCNSTVTSAPRLGLLHIHGLAGNCYENRFLDAVAEQCSQRGVTFLSINTRGHDYLADVLLDKDGAFSYQSIGGAREIFQDCTLDIEAGIRALRESGCERVVLEGHSTGALKTVYYCVRERPEIPIAALILLSPSDDHGLQMHALGTRYQEVLREAQSRVRAGKGEDFLPAEVFPYPISARSYASFFGSPETNVFHFDDSTVPFSALASLTVPVLATFGTVEEAVVGNRVEHALATLKQAVGAVSFEGKIIEGAPHNYLGKEVELGQIVGSWMSKVVLGS